jgi:hypothetical protein
VIPSLFHKLRAPAAGRSKTNGSSNGNRKNSDNGNVNNSRNHNRSSNRNCNLNRMAIVHVAFKSSSTAPPAAAHAQYIARESQYQQRHCCIN